ncbi:uncharacterized protein (DUF1778 family) [Algisphaera agarilytica]|uniref:Uncharacterized protein (DUF1778 family) n=2 Tax=Algisphaera agarilytica TaxID=1385975 RepID=A0A7X0H8T5_9BACT|nr:uncharacterized protein (DUF1778 family) [Algisphaera agarilytica]
MEKTENRTASYSTRFSPQQRDVIDEAAKLSGCSAAKFIREAAVARATDTVNASEEAGAVLKRLAALVVEQLQNPGVREFWHDGPPEVTNTVKEEWRWDSFAGEDGYVERRYREETLVQAGFRKEDVQPLYLADEDLSQIELALDCAGTEFVGMLLDAWKKPRRNQIAFAPRIRKSNLAGTEEDSDA